MKITLVSILINYKKVSQVGICLECGNPFNDMMHPFPLGWCRELAHLHYSNIVRRFLKMNVSLCWFFGISKEIILQY